MAQALFIDPRDALERLEQERDIKSDQEQRLERSRQVVERLKKRHRGQRSAYCRGSRGGRPALRLALLVALVAAVVAVQVVMV